MKRTLSRRIIGDGRWRDADLPFKIAAAMALRDIVNIWFDGSQTRAAEALGVSRAVLWRQMTGRDVVSRPMVRRMLLLTADERERSRRAREALEAANREGEIVLVRHAIDRLAAADAIRIGGNSTNAINKHHGGALRQHDDRERSSSMSFFRG